MVHLQQAHGYKPNTTVGAITAHKVSDRLRYFHNCTTLILVAGPTNPNPWPVLAHCLHDQHRVYPVKRPSCLYLRSRQHWWQQRQQRWWCHAMHHHRQLLRYGVAPDALVTWGYLPSYKQCMCLFGAWPARQRWTLCPMAKFPPGNLWPGEQWGCDRGLAKVPHQLCTHVAELDLHGGGQLPATCPVLADGLWARHLCRGLPCPHEVLQHIPRDWGNDLTYNQFVGGSLLFFWDLMPDDIGIVAYLYPRFPDTMKDESVEPDWCGWAYITYPRTSSPYQSCFDLLDYRHPTALFSFHHPWQGYCLGGPWRWP